MADRTDVSVESENIQVVLNIMFKTLIFDLECTS